MLKRFGEPGRRDRSGDISNADRLEAMRRQSSRGKPCPERVAIARHGRESSDTPVTYEVVDRRALDECGAVIAAVRARKVRAGPRFGQALRQVVRVGPEVECRLGVSPDLPGRIGSLELVQEPLFLR